MYSFHLNLIGFYEMTIKLKSPYIINVARQDERVYVLILNAFPLQVSRLFMLMKVENA